MKKGRGRTRRKPGCSALLPLGRHDPSRGPWRPRPSLGMESEVGHRRGNGVGSCDPYPDRGPLARRRDGHHRRLPGGGAG